MVEWVIISNPKLYNLEGAFNEFNEIDYKQSTNICTNDVIYIYVAAPYKEIDYVAAFVPVVSLKLCH